MKRKFPVRQAILELAPYQPGKPIEEVARELGLRDIVKMASNENPLGPSPRALEAIRQALPSIHLYPDGAGFHLKQKLAKRFDLGMDCFTLGNGSSDILSFALWAFVKPGDEVLSAKTTFLMYPILAKIAHGTLVEVPLKNWCFDLEAMAKRINRKTRIVFLCNPNNPTGTIFHQRQWDAFLKKVPDHTVVVVDEAYMEFVDECEARPDFPNSIKDVRGGKNVVVLRTFSKIVGLAGLRIGYGVSTPQIADWLNRVRPPFNTNTLAQVAAAAAMDDEGHIERTKKLVLEGREYLATQIDKCGLVRIPSSANYIMIKVKTGGRSGCGTDGDEVYRRLLRKGIIVRSMKSFGMADWIRVTIGTMEQNKRFIRELKKILV